MSEHKILVVDDEPSIVDAVATALRYEGYEVEEATTGREVLAAIVGLGLWVVRLGLRPLDAIGTTAAAIAAGDLSQRVERAEERTEVGRLGLALNAMLAQIESAFKARAASEEKLRRFVADASHELRTPLAAVRAYAELFTRGAERRPEDLARSPRRGPAARARAGRARRGRRRGRRHGAHRRAGAADLARRRAGRRPRRPRPAAADRRQPARQRA